MPIIKSAKKRVKTARTATLRNSKSKRSLKSAVKAFSRAVSSGDKSAVTKSHKKAQSELGKARKKGILHKNKVARKQRQLARAAKSVANTKQPVTKPRATPKKSSAKKTPTKKSTPATKKK